MKLQRVLPLALSTALLLTGVSKANPSSKIYSESVYSYADVCNMSEAIFNSTQIRINKAVYAQAATVMEDSHYNICYGDVNTKIFNSFKKYFNPICILSFSTAEWGKYNDLRYSFTPAIATSSLSKKSIDISTVDPLQINKEYYACMGITFDDKTYWGPLQIHKSYLSESKVGSYKCGHCPMDYYAWGDAVQWTFHDKCNYVKNAWNKDYEFRNEYAVVAHMSIAHNSGGTHLSLQNYQNGANWYPWKSSQAVFNYVDKITTGDNLQIILNDADSYADELLSKYAAGNVTGGLYKSINDCRKLTAGMNIDWNTVVKSEWLGNMTLSTQLSGDALRNWEKVMYPVQSIWNYRVLQRLYGLV